MKSGLVAALLLSLTAGAAPSSSKRITLLFTGDNGAQVAPCG